MGIKRINLLDENTSNKIAAGEVVERPSSVVKELIENSIDANSKNITVEIEEGGVSLIRIIDDGDGIYPEDIKKAFLPHATSKIKNSEDIFAISTLGFRGEALPSIASVAKVNMKSKINAEDFGREIIIEGGNIVDFNECGVNKGTTIEVRDIFYNVPARKKFLKSTSREASLITDIVNRTAIAHPDISFKLYNNGKKAVHTYGNGKLIDTLRTIYGKTISENLLYFEKTEDIVTLYGFIGKEEIARGSRNNQSIFVNGRYIKNRALTVAVENAFKSFSTCNKFPFFTLNIEVYPDLIDVNIHPTKAEIKFKDERLIFKLVFDAVHEALKKDVFDNFMLPEENKTISEYVPEAEEIKFDIKPVVEDEKVKFQSFETREKFKIYIPVDLKSEVTFQSEPVIVKEKSFNDSFNNKKIQENTYANDEPIVNTNERDIKDLVNEELQTSIDEHEPKTTEEDFLETKVAKFPPLEIIGQFNKTYIIASYEDVLYMIDQHAAHEKILFEKYLKDIEKSSLIIQPLLVPTIIDLTIDDYACYEENEEVFKNAGFTLESFGGNSLSLKEVPYFLGRLDPKGLFLSILDDLKALGSGKTTEVKYNKIATMACKAAVKGNDKLSDIEMIKLIEELRYIDDPFHCPHGRPTIIKFTNNDLEKKFRRIV